MRAAQINTSFEILGFLLAWQSAWLAFVERPQGVSWAYIGLSALWALNCFPYYRAKGETLAACCALGRALANTVWCVGALS